MALLRLDPFTALARMDQDFDDLVRRTFGAEANQFVPPVEMATEGSDVVITLEIPGVDVVRTGHRGGRRPPDHQR